MHIRNLNKLNLLLVVSALVMFLLGTAGMAHAVNRLDPNNIPKFVNPVPKPPEYAPNKRKSPGKDYYEISVKQFQQDLGLGIPFMTTVWGYGGKIKKSNKPVWNYPAPSFEAIRGIPVKVKWINDLRDYTGTDPGSPAYNLAPILTTHLLEEAYDTSIHGAEADLPQVRIVTHLHGGEVPPSSDGFPEYWYTADPDAAPNGMGGPAGNYDIYDYPNRQNATTLWYHDHALGITRLNVNAGLAGFYFLRDKFDLAARGLPKGKYEMPLVIQDRSFNEDGSFFFPSGGSGSHPIWEPEFFGDTILVNGKAWPFMKVEPKKYRLRLLNGSDSRFYSLRIESATDASPAVYQIGTDGGYLERPVPLTERLTIAPGERADLIVDFSKFAPGTTFTMTNNAPTPFPDGGDDMFDPRFNPNVAEIMQFKVIRPSSPFDLSRIPGKLNSIPKLTAEITRTMTLNEAMVNDQPDAALLNNLHWDMGITETPKVGSTEAWEIINMTGDTHPIHLHLAQFQILNREAYDTAGFEQAYADANPDLEPGMGATIPDITPYLDGNPVPPKPSEAGWKDTVQMNPGEVTRILIRFESQDGRPYSFDPTAGRLIDNKYFEGRYVWHCHILSHEDNEMMRPYKLTN